MDVVLAVHGPPSRRHGLAGLCSGVAAGTVALLTLGAPRMPPRPSWPPPRPSETLEISLEEPREATHPAHPMPEASAAPSSSRPPLAPRAATRLAARAVPVEPAQAARVLTRAPRADEPVDLTGEVFVAGTAQRYLGGTTSATGTSADAGPRRGASGEPASAGSGCRGCGPTDQSRPVSLAAESWACPWPSEAEPLPIDEQTVVIRVVSRADGSVEAVTVVSDPGHGFGEAAASCARQARFRPARASNGETVRAASPPIMVRFTR